MRQVSLIFRTKEVQTFLAHLIHHQDYQSYKDFSFGDKCEFVSLLMKAVGPRSDHEFFYESDDLHSTMVFFRKALNGTNDDDENFLVAIKTHAIKYHEEIMIALFEEALDDYEAAKNQWLAHREKDGEGHEACGFYLDELERDNCLWNPIT